METPFPKKVDAQIVRDGETLRVEPDPIRVQAGGAIDWWCDVGSFAVVFKRTGGGDSNPLDGSRVRHGHKGSGPGSGVEGKIRGNANGPGTRNYTYTVAVCADGEVFAEDPEVVVGPETGP